MALERRNGGRNKHSRGHDKAIKLVRDIVEQAAVIDAQEARYIFRNKMMARVQVVVRRLLQLLPYLRLVAAVAVFLSSDPYYHALTF
uniref:Uncharacterized protein n=1 Tax=Leersia perrieri TaxID=77586 RepID=A0A0D9W0N8_9ORYZ